MPQEDDRKKRAAAKRKRARTASTVGRMVGNETRLARFIQNQARKEAAQANRESREILRQMPKKKKR